MKLNTAKFQEINKEERQNVNGGVGVGDAITIIQLGWQMAKDYGKGRGPEMERQYKHGMPGGKW